MKLTIKHTNLQQVMIKSKEFICFPKLWVCTLTDIYYIAKKQKGREVTIQFISSILEFLEIATVDKRVVLDALELDF